MGAIRINVCDTETTGFAVPPDGDIVEIAVTPLNVLYDDFGMLKDIKVGETVSQLANPECSISWEAMAVHHITAKMVAGEDSADIVKAKFRQMPCDYWAFHNAAFDLKFFKVDQPVICTLETSRIIYPQAPSHKNQVLRYWLDLDSMMKKERMGETHRAGFDTYCTALLLAKMIMTKKMDLQDMAKIQDSPIYMGNIGFGKHKGTPWAQVPASYLIWLRENSTDVKAIATARHYLQRK